MKKKKITYPVSEIQDTRVYTFLFLCSLPWDLENVMLLAWSMEWIGEHKYWMNGIVKQKFPGLNA